TRTKPAIIDTLLIRSIISSPPFVIRNYCLAAIFFRLDERIITNPSDATEPGTQGFKQLAETVDIHAPGA
ncbi:MAG: hypothetical protein K9K87_12565, partial [Desulfotignum sp.]|nr:hypothetical protein [Desulfotignum sp.]